MNLYLRSTVFFIGVALLFGAGATRVHAENPQATSFPREGEQVLAEKGDVSYWFEQAKTYGQKTVGPLAPAMGTDRHPQFSLTLSNGTLVCSLAANAPTNDVTKMSFTDPVDQCAFEYPETGHVRVFYKNALDGAKDILYDQTGPDARKITIADGGAFGEKNADGTAKVVAGDAGKCGLTDVFCNIAKLPGMLFAGLAFLLLTLSSFFLFLSGVVFNWVVIRTVFQFATYFGTSAGMLVAWGVLRDIGNIALLFGFIFMGIATILNTHNVEGYTARKALPQLIIFAVLLNFSLFASQAVIDVANGFSSVFSTYAGQSCNTGASGSASVQSDSDCANIGISGKILAAVGMNHLIPSGDSAMSALSSAWEKPYTYSAMLILLSVLVTITAVVLLAAAIMLSIRVVVLSLLMVTSPIGFAGMAIPALHGLASDWWHRLINQSFFAPIYLLMVFLSLKLVENLMVGNATVSDAIMGNQLAGSSAAGNMQVVMVFIIVIGFMIAALMIAQKMGAYGATFATNAASGIVYGGMARGMNLMAGGLGMALRAGARQRAAALRAQKKEPGMGTLALTNLGTRLKGANLDPRRLPGVAAALKAGGATSGANVASHATFAAMQHQLGDITSGKAFNEMTAKNRAELLQSELDVRHGKPLDPNDPHDKELKKHLQGRNTDQLLHTHGIPEGDPALIQELKQSQVDDLLKSDKLSENQKANIRAAWESRFVGAPGAARIESMQREDIDKLDAKTIAGKDLGNVEFLNNLDTDHLINLYGSNKFNATQKQNINQVLVARAANTPADFANLPSDQFNKLSPEIVAQTQVLAVLQPSQLLTMSASDKYSTTQKANIDGEIAARFASGNMSTASMSSEQLDKLPPSVATSDSVIASYDPVRLTTMSASNKYDSSQKARIDAQLATHFTPENASATLARMTSEQKGKLSAAIISQPHVYKQFDSEAFETVRTNKNLTDADRRALGQHIAEIATDPNHPQQAEFLAYANSDPRIKTYWHLPV